ncbi:hypothetical protein [Aeromonas enteropelogenes]|uniref:hypothetical protein n=1 Tax=Aeromonas enteropelogenes TaxID=29489 RepID=UPI0038CF9B0A
MDTIDFDNLTGAESLEELEAALNALEDEEEHVEQQEQVEQPSTDEKGEQTAPPAAEEQGQDKVNQDDQQSDELETDKVILSKDGKHQIPYDVLEAERAQRQALAAENAQLKTEVVERERLQALLDKHGINPDTDPDALNPEDIEQLTQDYPEIGKVLTGIAKRLDKLTQPTYQQHEQPLVNAIPNDVQTALQAVPELATWMEHDQDRATFAVSVDERLKADPMWKNKPLAERFAEVTKRTKAAFGDMVEPPAPPASEPAPDTLVEQDHIPSSPSDLGQSVQHESTLEKYGAMSQEQLMAEMSNMSAAQIEELLAEHDL